MAERSRPLELRRRHGRLDHNGDWRRACYVDSGCAVVPPDLEVDTVLADPQILDAQKVDVVRQGRAQHDPVVERIDAEPEQRLDGQEDAAGCPRLGAT